MSEKEDVKAEAYAKWQADDRTVLTPFSDGFDAGWDARDQKTCVVYAVVFSNYSPSEVDSLWTTQEAANARMEELQGDWNVVEWTVQKEKTDERTD